MRKAPTMHYRCPMLRLASFFSVLALAMVPVAAASASPSAADGAPKVLRYAMVSDATTLDPAAISDIYSQEVAGSIFEPLYRFDYLARPVKVKPQLAAALPE